MKHLTTFKNFQSDFTLDFIYGRITKDEYISHLESLNENWISDSYEKVKWKVTKKLRKRARQNVLANAWYVFFYRLRQWFLFLCFF